MTINYILVKNHLKPDSDEYMARVISSGTVDVETLVDDMIGGGSTVTHPDILAVLNAYYSAIIKRLLAGQRVLTPVANFSVSIRGPFENASDAFDSSRHVIHSSVSTGADLRSTMREHAQVAKGEAPNTAPNPIEYVDFGSERKNSALTTDKPGQLTGHRLKVDAADPQQGVFFIAAKDGAEARATMLMRNEPANLMFIVPAGLAPGDYEIEVRTITTQDGVIQRGRLRHVVSVA